MSRDRENAKVLWVVAAISVFVAGITILEVWGMGEEISQWSIVGTIVFILLLGGLGWYLWDRDDRNQKE